MQDYRRICHIEKHFNNTVKNVISQTKSGVIKQLVLPIVHITGKKVPTKYNSPNALGELFNMFPTL
jgi:hypothetical protein